MVADKQRYFSWHNTGAQLTYGNRMFNCDIIKFSLDYKIKSTEKFSPDQQNVMVKTVNGKNNLTQLSKPIK